MIQKISKWFSIRNKPVLNQNIDKTAIENKIKYNFKNNNLLIQAVSHRSYYVEADKQLYSNERLEFLGDAVLELIVTEFLYSRFKNENEGDLSQKKAILVSRKVLGKLAFELGLGEFLILNKGEEKTGGRKRLSNLANLFEAILGAIYIDGGLEHASDFVNYFLLSRQNELLKASIFYNYKSHLLEFAQSKNWGSPKYKVVQESGPDHQKLFTVDVTVNEGVAGQGSGLNKKSAEQLAAKNTLEILSKSHSKTKP